MEVDFKCKIAIAKLIIIDSRKLLAEQGTKLGKISSKCFDKLCYEKM